MSDFEETDSADTPSIPLIEAARTIGGYNNHSSVMNDVIRRVLPAVKIGGRWFITPRDLERIIAAKAARSGK